MRILVSSLMLSLLASASPLHAAEAVPDVPVPAAKAPPSDPNAKPTRKRVAVSLEGGAEFRHLFDIPVTGIDLRGSVGPADAFERRFWPAAFASLLIARTEAGLGVNHVVLGPRFEGRWGFVYAGASLGFGYFWVNRADGGIMDNAEGLIDLFLGPQLELGGNTALSLEGRLSAEFLPGIDGTIAFGPGVALRLRFY